MVFQLEFLKIKFFRLVFLANFILFGIALANESNEDTSTASYLKNIAQTNRISFHKIINTRGAYIPSMCYTKTLDENDEVINPCYSCHTNGTIPNFKNDSNLQQELVFPPEMLTNPYSNLFQDHSEKIAAQSDKEILDYVRQSNYIKNQQIVLAKKLPIDWPGYRPDSYFNFDSDGFDRTPEGGYSLWRAFRYYPFPGTFWPTNGSADDVLIRLDAAFSKNLKAEFDLQTYIINLAIVESLVKQKTIQLKTIIDEKKYQQDLNQNGKLDNAKIITFPPKSYIGYAAIMQQKGVVHLAAGLYPENTEFLHSVRYLDWDEDAKSVTLAARMKELRYSKKYQWMTYSELNTDANMEFWDAQTSDNDDPPLVLFRGDASSGMHTTNGWTLQGFIEDKSGQLRPQTREESLYCMGCHSGIGATTDASFAMPRKLQGAKYDFGWQHWSQAGLKGIAEAKVDYKNNSDQYEYSFYLQNNHSANEFATNQEVKNKFFNDDGSANKKLFSMLHDDISILLLPTKKRAIELNKAYRVTVQKQSFIYGREGNSKPLENVHKKIKAHQKTDIVNIISQ
jgi:hypothetical protein